MGLEGEDGFPHDGVIDFINNQFNPLTGTIAVRGVFANPKSPQGARLFAPGMFVRVRLPRVDDLDLNVFEFDYDVTFMVFFLDADDRVYARYGGRDSQDADNRQTLEGLRYTMESVAKMHARENKEYAPKAEGAAPP